jgi:hypothetical protein
VSGDSACIALIEVIVGLSMINMINAKVILISFLFIDLIINFCYLIWVYPKFDLPFGLIVFLIFVFYMSKLLVPFELIDSLF